MLRAISSFFDRILLDKFTYDKVEVDKKIEGVSVSNESDDRVLMQITLYEISSRSVQALVNFAYTGNVAIETNSLKRAIEDFKSMNVSAIIGKLERSLEEDLSLIVFLI